MFSKDKVLVRRDAVDIVGKSAQAEIHRTSGPTDSSNDIVPFCDVRLKSTPGVIASFWIGEIRNHRWNHMVWPVRLVSR